MIYDFGSEGPQLVLYDSDVMKDDLIGSTDPIDLKEVIENRGNVVECELGVKNSKGKVLDKVVVNVEIMFKDGY